MYNFRRAQWLGQKALVSKFTRPATKNAFIGRRSYSDSGNNPWSGAGKEEILGGTGDGKSSFDIYSELNIPLNNIRSLLGTGYLLESGESVITSDPARPKGLLLLGTDAFQIDCRQFTGLDTGLVEMDLETLRPLEVVHPRPEILVIGLGGKSRILGPKTQQYLRELGIRHHLASSRSAASSFNLLSMERGNEIGGLLLTTNI